MTTFAAEVVGEAVILTVASLTQAGTITVDRSGGVVRGTPVALAAGGGTVLTDNEYPFEGTLTYTLTVRDTDTGVTLETLTTQITPPDLTGSLDLVITNSLARESVAVYVFDENDFESDSRTQRFDLSGRIEPIFLYETHTEWSWTLTCGTSTQRDTKDLSFVLRTGLPVLLRPARDCDQEYGWVAVGPIEMIRGVDPGVHREWNIEVSRAPAPDSTIELGLTTLQDLHEWEPTTLQMISDRVPTTLLDLTLTVTRNA